MWRSALRHSAVGLEMGVAIGAGYLLGHWLDAKFDTAPYLTWGGLALGIATAFRAIFRIVKEVKFDDDDSDDAPHDPREHR